MKLTLVIFVFIGLRLWELIKILCSLIINFIQLIKNHWLNILKRVGWGILIFISFGIMVISSLYINFIFFDSLNNNNSVLGMIISTIICTFAYIGIIYLINYIKKNKVTVLFFIKNNWKQANKIVERKIKYSNISYLKTLTKNENELEDNK